MVIVRPDLVKVKGVAEIEAAREWDGRRKRRRRRGRTFEELMERRGFSDVDVGLIAAGRRRGERERRRSEGDDI